MSSCASYFSRTHDVIDDVTRSQSRSNFAIDISPFITRDSEGIMFSPCVSVCVRVSVYVCHDVCLDDLTKKDWCHTNTILQVHCWGCLVVQVMFHALMTSLMTSQDHKVGQILQLIYLRQYLSYSVDQKLKMSEMIMAIFLVNSTFGITSDKIVCRELKWRPFWKFWNIKHSFNLTSDMKRSSKIYAKKGIFMMMSSLAS